MAALNILDMKEDGNVPNSLHMPGHTVSLNVSSDLHVPTIIMKLLRA